MRRMVRQIGNSNCAGAHRKLSEGKDSQMNLQHLVSICGVKRMLLNAVAAAVMFALAQPMWSQSPRHPLDGLTAPEIWTAYEVLQASKKVDADTPRAEDWPVMPTAWHEFELQPVNFFAHNPALDLPK
jgi:Cu2+-containing amine oxidase